MNIPQNQNNKSKDSDAEEYEDEDDLEDIEADDPDNTLTEEVDKDILRYKESQDDDEESEE
jgi:hypothetical protein